MWELIGTHSLLLGMTVFLPRWPEPACSGPGSPHETPSRRESVYTPHSCEGVGPGASETLTVHELLSQAPLRMTALKGRV